MKFQSRILNFQKLLAFFVSAKYLPENNGGYGTHSSGFQINQTTESDKAE